MTNQAKNMFDYHVWAMATMIKRFKELPAETYMREIVSVFPSLSKVLAHIYLVDRCWLRILEGQEMSAALEQTMAFQHEYESLSLTELEKRYALQFEEFRVLLQSQQDLDALITLDNPYAGVRETSKAEIILQMVNHGTYHRGNMTAMLRQMGIPSVMTEYALFWYADQQQMSYL